MFPEQAIAGHSWPSRWSHWGAWRPAEGQVKRLTGSHVLSSGPSVSKITYVSFFDSSRCVVCRASIDHILFLLLHHPRPNPRTNTGPGCHCTVLFVCTRRPATRSWRYSNNKTRILQPEEWSRRPCICQVVLSALHSCTPAVTVL